MLQTLTDICTYLRNWFDVIHYTGEITIKDGVPADFDDKLQNNQYYRIVGSVFNDGVHKFGDSDLVDEIFSGAIWAMAVPPTVIALATDIKEWVAKYGGVDSAAMSPYNSESFAGYSYSKTSGSNADGSNSNSWQSAFSAKLAPYRKL